jgi:hypothetical protein
MNYVTYLWFRGPPLWSRGSRSVGTVHSHTQATEFFSLRFSCRTLIYPEGPQRKSYSTVGPIDSDVYSYKPPWRRKGKFNKA